MDDFPPFITDSEASILKGPAQGPLDYPAEGPRSAAVLHAPLRQQRLDSELVETFAGRLRVIPAVPQQGVGVALGFTLLSRYRQIITNPVVINGYTQPGASPNTQAGGINAVPLVEWAKSPGGSVFQGFNISANDCTVMGMDGHQPDRSTNQDQAEQQHHCGGFHRNRCQGPQDSRPVPGPGRPLNEQENVGR